MGTKALLLGTMLPLASLAFPDHLEQRFPTVPNIMEFDCSVIPEVCAVSIDRNISSDTMKD
ncbi:hypothetical protein LTR37_008523 [Vermiconidia calcicola]|uniref:Uncharacterized protein n=1 Tax=Vermiconidia calcicola TaxID=1690605 RepID=A0ACC3NBX9_9PEZI|nr:hypothetical protein LTR37_008523 [Vermiconidia calcicola]